MYRIGGEATQSIVSSRSLGCGDGVINIHVMICSKIRIKTDAIESAFTAAVGGYAQKRLRLQNAIPKNAHCPLFFANEQPVNRSARWRARIRRECHRRRVG